MNHLKRFLMIATTLALCSCASPDSNHSTGNSSSDSSSTIGPEHTIEEHLLSEKINLINLKGKTTFDLLDGDRYVELYTETAKGTLSYSLISLIDGSETDLSSSVVDFSSTPKQYYVAVIYDNWNGIKDPIYAYYVDFYDENDPFEWNSFNYSDDTKNIMVKVDFHDDDHVFSADTNDYIKAISYNAKATTVIAGEGPNGEKGNYYRIHSDPAGYLGYAEGVLINFAPLHSKSYYRLFDDAEYEISYDIFIEGSNGIDQKTGIDVPEEEIYCALTTISEKPGTGENKQSYNRAQYYGVGGWKHVVLPVKDYYGANPKLVELKETMPNTKVGWSWMVDKEDLWCSDYPKKNSMNYMLETDVYIGNFMITRTKYNEIDYGLIDVANTSLIDLSSFSGERYELYKENETGKRVFVKEFNEENLDISSLRGMHCIDVFDGSDSLLCKIKFDSYKSGEMLEWGEDAVASSSILWGVYDGVESQNVMLEKVSAENESKLSGQTGSFYKVSCPVPPTEHALNFLPSPIHSKDYYDLFGDSLMEYGIRYKVMVDSDGGNLPLYNASIKHDYTSSDADYDSIVKNPHNSGTWPIKFCFYEYSSDVWLERTLSLDVLYECYEAYRSAIKDLEDTNNVVAGSSLVSVTTHRSRQGGNLLYYVGGLNIFRYDMDEKLRYSDIKPSSIPEGASFRSDVDSIDLTQYISASNLRLLNKYGNEETIEVLVTKSGTTTNVYHSPILQIADSLSKGTYSVSLSLGGYPMLEGTILIYDYDPELDGFDLSFNSSSSTSMCDVNEVSLIELNGLPDLSSGNIAAMNSRPDLVNYALRSPIAEDVIGNGISIDINTLEKTVYTVEIFIKEFQIYQGEIDVFDIRNIAVDDWLNLSTPHVENNSEAFIVSRETYVPYHGLNGDFIKIEKAANDARNGNVNITLHPVHSKSYYEKEEVNSFFSSKMITFKAYGYATDGTHYYGVDDGYYLSNILATRHDQEWLVGGDGSNISPGLVPSSYPDGKHGVCYFSIFVNNYDMFRKGDDASVALFGMSGAGAKLVRTDGSEVSNLGFAIYVGEFKVEER